MGLILDPTYLKIIDYIFRYEAHSIGENINKAKGEENRHHVQRREEEKKVNLMVKQEYPDKTPLVKEEKKSPKKIKSALKNEKNNILYCKISDLSDKIENMKKENEVLANRVNFSDNYICNT